MILVRCGLTPDKLRASMATTAKRAGFDPEKIGVLGRFLTHIKSGADGDGFEVEGIATTDDVDCDGEVVLPDGLDWKPFQKYRVLYAEHAYGMKYAAATYRYVTRSKSPDGWKIRARLLPDAYSDEIQRVRMLADAGVLGLSIGFIPIESGPPTPEEQARYKGAASIVRRASVFEVSFTTMPCNMACVASAVYTDASKSAELCQMVTKGLARAEAVYAPGRKLVLVDC